MEREGERERGRERDRERQSAIQFCTFSKTDFEIRAASVIRENVVVPGIKYMQMSSGYKNEI